MATWVIGDVQGCHATLERLLVRLGKGERLWFVGDLVNRGPSSLKTLRRVRELGATVVLGNHDLHLLACAAGVAGPKGKDTIADVLLARDEKLLDWLAERPFLIHEAQATMIHAGLAPSWTVDDAAKIAAELGRALAGKSTRKDFLEVTARKEKSARWTSKLDEEARWQIGAAALTRLRVCGADGEIDLGFKGPPDEAPAGRMPWFTVPGRKSAGSRVVFGHWAALGLSLGTDHAGIDTGCVWGGALTAYRLDDGAVISEPTAPEDRP